VPEDVLPQIRNSTWGEPITQVPWDNAGD